MHEVIGDSSTSHGSGERFRPQRVALDRLNVVSPRPALQASRVAHKASHAIAGVQQPRHQSPADIAGRAGDKDCGCFIIAK
jgi:hypothetical protein